MTMFFQKLVEGFGAAGWVIGLMLGLGAFLVVFGALGYALLRVFDDDETEKEENL